MCLSLILELVAATGYVEEARLAANTCRRLRTDEQVWISILAKQQISLFYAIKTHDEKRLEWLCKRIFRPLLDYNTKKERDPILWYAARHNLSPRWIQVLCAKGASVNAVNIYDEAPLHEAIYRNRTELAKALIECGANISSLSKNRTPISIAVANGKLEMIKFLHKRGADTQDPILLFLAIECWELESLIELLKRGAPLDERNSHGRTLLHMAVACDHYYIVAHLLSLLDPNMRDSDGATPLMLARKPMIAELLLRNNASLHATDTYGSTALHYAAFNKHISIIKYLLKCKIDAKHVNNYGMTALENAVQVKCTPAIELLQKN